MRIGVFGAGAIGCYLGGSLQKGWHDVTLVGRLGPEIAAHGLTLTDDTGVVASLPPGSVRYESDATTLRDAEAVLVTVKSAATPEAARELAPFLAPGTIVVSFQNGVRNAAELRARLPRARVLAGMVPFNVLRQGEGRFHRGTSGPLAMETGAPELAAALRVAGFEVTEVKNLEPIQWTKLLMNLNNALNALAGIPLREQLAAREGRATLAASIAEGLRCLRAEGIRPARVGPVLPRLLPFILRLPDNLFARVAGAMLRIDPQARSSMWEDVSRGKPTEIDFLQGEIVRLGEKHGIPTPVNADVMARIKARTS